MFGPTDTPGSYTGRMSQVPPRKKFQVCHSPRTLSDDLDNTAGLLDLLLRERRNVSGLDDEWRVDSALAQLRVNLRPCSTHVPA